MLSISDSCSWNLAPCALLRSGVCSASDVVCGLVVVWHFQMIYSIFNVVVLYIHIETPSDPKAWEPQVSGLK